MNQLTAASIRKTFLEFFEQKGHKIVPSAPIVIKNDPTLLFTNAGMNQFKEYFLGNTAAPFKRAVDTQKCLRVSGKHNDLEEVGVDTYHHTMFEMLGNWSFGDYFKKEAIAWSWELLTEVYNIPKDRLYVTVFEGDEKEQLPFDQEAYNEWKKWISEERILKGNKKDNFWEMGDTGPCGPCSEIHVDCRPEAERANEDGAVLVNADHPQVIEIWNNVFMEFNRLKDGSLQPLPAKHVDTGMGFERLVRVLQGKQSNYDTDVFTGTITVIERIVNKSYTFGDDKISVSFRVLADHIRAIAFTIADGQLPAATGAGYVVRRILRRAVRYYYSYLDYYQPLLHQLIPVIASQFREVFPELYVQQELVSKVVKEEEVAFLKTLEKGIRRFEDYVKDKPRHIDGRFAFELYDTYGFPYDLTELMAKDVILAVDEAGFKEEMQQQKDRSRAATLLDTGDWQVLREQAQPIFTGYTDYTSHTKVIKYRSVSSKGKNQYQVVLEQTPFYPEGGGQIGDTGVLIFGEEVIEVSDTKKENDQIIHFVASLPAAPDVEVVAKVDADKRIATSYNHTATHLVHAALREVLGTHVHQKGSLVSDELLRFDIAHYSKITEEEIARVTDIVNDRIRQNIPVVIKELPKEEAMELGAMALFGEKYGDVVRTVIIDPAYSVELCGGTHVASTGMIGTFIITGESAVAAGVRRIEALTGRKAVQYVQEKLGIVQVINEQLKTKDTIKAFTKLQEDKSSLEKTVHALEQQALSQMAYQLAGSGEEKGAVTLVNKRVEVGSMDALKKLALDIKNKLQDAFVIIYAVANDKPMVAVAISDSLAESKGWDAGKIIKSDIAPLIKGGGGGQRMLASAGGQDVNGLKEIDNVVSRLMN